jgi:hypothetical protein
VIKAFAILKAFRGAEVWLSSCELSRRCDVSTEAKSQVYMRDDFTVWVLIKNNADEQSYCAADDLLI